MNLSRLHLSTRLYLGFASVLLACTLIVGFAVVQMRKLAAMTDDIGQNRMVKVAQFNQLSDNLNEASRLARDLMLDPKSADRGARERRIAETRRENSELLTKLRAAVTRPRAIELLATIDAQRPKYNAALDRAIALAAQGEAAEANAQLYGPVAEAGKVLFAAIDESTQLQTTMTVEQVSAANADASRTTLVLLGLLAGAALASAWVAWTTVRWLTRTLGAEPVELDAALHRVAEGDLATPLALRAGDSTSTLACVERMRAALVAVVRDVRGNADSVATGSSQIAQGNQDLSQRTEEQANALQTTASTMEQLSTTVTNNADNARQANQLALGASSVAGRGGELVEQVVATMTTISDSSRRIADIIGTIDGIAFQTNILALNAAVEAARAGEQGRGFAVVAAEVRNLAKRSADASREIRGLIQDSVAQVGQGSQLVEQAGRTMQEIVTSIRRVTDIVGEISAASEEQSRGVTQVGQAVLEMDKATQMNAALVEQSAAAAASLKQQAETLVQAVGTFRLAPA